MTANLLPPPRPAPHLRAQRLRLVLGDQLNAAHSWFQSAHQDVLYVFMEVRSESEYVTHHIQKIAGIFAAMRSFARALSERGHAVHYFSITDADNAHDFCENLRQLAARHGATHIEYQLPDEYRLDQLLSKLGDALQCTSSCVDTEHFLTQRQEVGEFFASKKVWRMENFYRYMRQRHNILLDANHGPLGERWNYDQENRNKLPKEHSVPSPFKLSNDVSAVVRDIEQAKLPYIGTIQSTQFDWPITRQQALDMLDEFLEHRLAHFGRFQDALSDRHWALYHCRLSQALNLKFISPLQVIDAAIAHWQANQTHIGLAQIEGFVRQILGWREYVRGIYWYHMPEYAHCNVLEHDRALPEFFWTGQTNMRCMQRAIQQSLQHGYAHHIQRLMVTGNFCALAGIEPGQVDQWYLGIYVDAFEWVELPNTRGMSQFADGGKLASKPYVSSANYLKKMGDHCAQCSYDPKLKHEDGACPFNSLYWRYISIHEARMRKNPRMSMMYRQLDKLKDKALVLQKAEQYLKDIETL